MVTVALGGASHWAQKLLPASVRLVIYGIGSAIVLVGVMVRLRYDHLVELVCGSADTA